MSDLRGSWTSRAGFILAAAGYAIGLGNIWRFSYVAGENGGGAFLIIYLAIMLLFGLPLFYAETALGRQAQSGIITGLRGFTRKGSPWVLIGWLGFIAAALISSYYFMIMGWIIDYFFKILFGVFNGLSKDQIQEVYTSMVTSPWEVFLFSLLSAVAIAVIVGKGVEEGIEKFSKVIMPLLMLLLVVLAIFSISQPGALAGLSWYLKPDFSVVTTGTVLSAIGQAFFSIGIGLAATFTYGSYLQKGKTNLVTDGALVIGLDTFVAFMSGLVIFPALFAFNIPPDSGEGLLFLSMPVLFDLLPFGTIFGLAFFFLVIIAGISTGVGLVEAVVVNVSEVFKISRMKSIVISTAVLVVLAIPSILSQGPWSHIKIFDRNLFEFIDYLSGNVMLPIGGLLIALYVTFVWKFENYQAELNIGTNKLKISSMMKPLITIIIPVLIGFIVITSIF